jgi:hypothetical protein
MAREKPITDLLPGSDAPAAGALNVTAQMRLLAIDARGRHVRLGSSCWLCLSQGLRCYDGTLLDLGP